MVLIFKGVDTLTEMIRERRGRDDRRRDVRKAVKPVARKAVKKR